MGIIRSPGRAARMQKKKKDADEALIRVFFFYPSRASHSACLARFSVRPRTLAAHGGPLVRPFVPLTQPGVPPAQHL
jgi:hypothetical protein